MEFFKERLTEARKNENLTQEELALRLGVTPQAVSKWERGAGFPDISMLCDLSRLLHCSADYLLSIPQLPITEANSEKNAKQILQKILAEPLSFQFGEGFVKQILEESKNGFQQVHQLRILLAEEFGILLPLLRVCDNLDLPPYTFRLCSYDKIILEKNYADNDIPDNIFMMLKEIIRSEYPFILNNQIVKTLVDNLASQYPAVAGIVPTIISYSELRCILVGLLEKDKSIRNLIKIIEYSELELKKSTDIATVVESVACKI